MTRQHVSERSYGKHPNAITGAVAVSDGGAPVTQGRSVSRNTDHDGAVLVQDSPPFVPIPFIHCDAIRSDGEPCMNKVHNAGEKCFGHKAGRGGPRG